MTFIMPTEQEIEGFFTCWREMRVSIFGAEVCAAIDAVFNTPPPEVEPWTDWTWADVQAQIEAGMREPENFARRVIGEPEVDPWEFANTRAYVEAVIEQTRTMETMVL
jgi:hypothetical protein